MARGRGRGKRELERLAEKKGIRTVLEEDERMVARAGEFSLEAWLDRPNAMARRGEVYALIRKYHREIYLAELRAPSVWQKIGTAILAAILWPVRALVRSRWRRLQERRARELEKAEEEGRTLHTWGIDAEGQARCERCEAPWSKEEAAETCPEAQEENDA